MKKRKKLAAKIIAFIALFAIVIWVIGTGLLVVVSSPWSETEITQEQLQEYIDSLSGSTTSSDDEIWNTLSGALESQ